METACHRKTLSDSPLGRLEVCTCGHVHVSIQAITIRLDPEAFAHLAGQMGEALYALTRLQQQGEVRGETVRPLWGAPVDGNA